MADQAYVGYREMSDRDIEHTLSLGGSPVALHIAYRQLKAAEALVDLLRRARDEAEAGREPAPDAAPRPGEPSF